MHYFSFLLVFFFNSISIASPETECVDKSIDIADKLKCIDNIKYIEEIVQHESGAGLRQFELRFSQPVDHTDTSLGHFQQRLVLLHRDEIDPMVLQTSGYDIFRVRQAVLTRMFRTNQIQVEHRHFADSKPSPIQWSKLTVKQSADDFHAIVEKFKLIYKKAWMNTGASKGGMTSMYHRYFYPGDVSVTVADVAPLSFTRNDQRYNHFIRNVGGKNYKQCREDFFHMQTEVLKNRDSIAKLKGDFSYLGGPSIAFEHAVIESIFYFWQYGNPEHPLLGCNSIPAKGSPQEMFEFIKNYSRPSTYENPSIFQFMPYFYQAATELGGPDNLTEHLEPYRRHEFNIQQYIPHSEDLTYNNQLMRDIDHWVRTEADRVIMVYGTLDPWTAAEFPGTETDRDVYKFYVEGGNHGANISKLNLMDKSFATTQIENWIGKAAVDFTDSLELDFFNQKQSLDEVEFKERLKRGLRL